MVSRFRGDNKILRRYLSEQERDRYYMSWVEKNGLPRRRQGCINCAELICYEDCRGIDDERVNRIE
jgi:hypothetical protein